MITRRMESYLEKAAVRTIEIARAGDGTRYIARIGYRMGISAELFVTHAAGHGATPTEALAALDLNMRRE